MNEQNNIDVKIKNDIQWLVNHGFTPSDEGNSPNVIYERLDTIYGDSARYSYVQFWALNTADSESHAWRASLDKNDLIYNTVSPMHYGRTPEEALNKLITPQEKPTTSSPKKIPATINELANKLAWVCNYIRNSKPEKININIEGQNIEYVVTIKVARTKKVAIRLSEMELDEDKNG